MRYNTSVLAETVTILGRFQSGRTAAQVTVALFNAATGASIPVTSPNTAEIGTTGVYRFSTSQITTQPTAFTEILYIMTDTITNRTHDGKIVLGGHVDNLDAAVSSRASAAALATVQADTDDIQTRLPASLSGGRMRSQVEGMDAGVVTAAAIATDAIDADALAASALAEIAFAAWDEVLTGATHNITNSAGKRLRQLADQGIVAEGTAQAGATATITLDAGDTRPTDFYRDMILGITEGTGAGQIRVILTYNGGTKVATPHRAWEVIPDATSKYVIGLVGASAILSDATRFSGGFIDAAISSRAAPGDAMDLVAGAVDAAAIATDAIDSDAIAPSAVTEIQAGLATAAAVAGVQADTDDIQTRLPASLVTGRMRSHVEALDAGVITPTVAPNLDAAVSSRATQASVDALAAASYAVQTTAAAGSTTTEIRTPLTQADGYFRSMYVLVVLAGGPVVRRIEEFKNLNGAITVEDPLPAAPGVGNSVFILAIHNPSHGGA